MNILYILNEPDPRMTHFGGAQRTNYIWRALQMVGDVYTMTLDQRFETQEVAPRLWYVKKLQKVNLIRDFFYKIQTRIFNTFKVLYCFPLSTKIEKTPEELFPDIQFDVVVCRYLDVLGEMHLWGHPRLIVDIDDDPLQMYNTVKCLDVHPYLRPFGRWILRRQLLFLKNKVRIGWLSNVEQVAKLKYLPQTISLNNIAIQPSDSYNYTSGRLPVLVIIGSLSYSPNYLGIDYFLSNIWTSFHKRFPDVKLHIVGKGTPMEYLEKWNEFENVYLIGYVEHLEDVYEKCQCSVVPILSGGGTCIKTRESMSFGRVCLTTLFGARGIDIRVLDGTHGIQVYETAEDFISLYEKYILPDNIRIAAEKAAVDYIRTTHSETYFFNVVKQTIDIVC